MAPSHPESGKGQRITKPADWESFGKSEAVSSGISLHAPHFLDIEVAQVIRRYALQREIMPERALAVFAELSNMPLQRHPHGFLLPRVWELRHNLTAYDAVYVALAESFNVPLLTHDSGLANSSGHHARIELV